MFAKKTADAAEKKPTDHTSSQEAPTAAPAPDELQQLKAKCDEYLNGWKRAQADYINYKKETEKKQSELIQFATMGFILELLPVLNNFKAALRQMQKNSAAQKELEGFQLIKKQLEDLLKSVGIEEIKEVKEFNPEFHEAVAHEHKEGAKEGEIIEFLQSGYTMHGKVVEAAKVKVAKSVPSDNKGQKAPEK